MEPRNHPARKDHGRKRPDWPGSEPKQPKLPVHTTVVLLLALYAALAAAGLLYEAHQDVWLIMMGSISAFVTAYDFLDSKIE
jgi:hypothetical protein